MKNILKMQTLGEKRSGVKSETGFELPDPKLVYGGDE